jgi:hypothetical protein
MADKMMLDCYLVGKASMRISLALLLHLGSRFVLSDPQPSICARFSKPTLFLMIF